MRARFSISFPLAVLLAACGGAVSAKESPENAEEAALATRSSRTFRVIQYNLTGAARPYTLPPSAPGNRGSLLNLDYLTWAMEAFPAVGAAMPDAVLLEEVCHDQFEELERRYPGHVVFSPLMQIHPWCVGPNQQEGQVLLSPWPLSNITRTPLGGTDTTYGKPEYDKVFSLLCAELQVPGVPKPVKACVSHLRGAVSPAPVDAYKFQVDRIAEVVNPAIRSGQPVIFGGDLNNKPEYRTLDGLYHLDRVGGWHGDGLMNEADQSDPRYFKLGNRHCTATACRSGELTTSEYVGDGCERDVNKYDYVFFSGNVTGNTGFTELSAMPLPLAMKVPPNCPGTFEHDAPTSRSDHHLYRAQAVLTF